MSEELKPCPFCGKSRPENWTEVNKLVLCPYCETVALRRTWNRRPIEDAQAVRIAELETERDRMREALEKIAQWDMLARSQKGLIAIIEVLKDTARETLEGTGE